jgi:transposase
VIQAPALTGVKMSNLFWLTDEQMERLKPFFPKSHGKQRVDDRRVLSGIIFINRNGLQWCDAPREYGPPKTLYNRWKRWGFAGNAPPVRACPR